MSHSFTRSQLIKCIEIYNDMLLSDKFYSDYSKIRTSLKYKFIPTKESARWNSKATKKFWVQD